MRTAIFDLDGTLADTSADLLNAANACFEVPPLDLATDRLTAFHGGRAMITLGFERMGWPPEEDEITRLQARFIEAYENALDVETVLYPGVKAALDRLADAGWALGVCTNKPVHMAVPLLESLGIRDRFRAILGVGSLPVRKPDPLHLTEAIRRSGGVAERAVLIGDTITDRKAAANAGVPCVLVEFGPSGKAVAALEPEALLPHYDQIDEVLAGLLP